MFGSSTPTTTSLFPSVTAPSVSNSASNATKAFASFLGSTPAISSKSQPDDQEEGLKAETKYLTALRGLNVSLIAAISKAIDADPFLDVGEVLERYKHLRISVKSEYDDNLKKLKPKQAEISASKVGESKPSFGFDTAPTKPAAAMPAPPASFSGFTPVSSSSSLPSSSSIPSGFVPKSVSSVFGGPSTTSSDDKSSSASSKPFDSNIFSGSKPQTSSSDDKSSSAPKSAFSFGPSASSSSTTSSPFSFGTPANKPISGNATAIFGTSPPNAPSIFSSNLFGKSDEDKDKSSSTAAESAGKISTSFPSSSSGIFGNSSGSAFGSSSTSTGFNLSGTSGSSSTSSKTSPFGSFGTSGGSTSSFGSPVGFGFGIAGGSAKTTEGDSSTSFPSTSAPKTFQPFSASSNPFGSVTKSTTESERAGESSQAQSQEGTPAAEDGSRLLTPASSVHDMEGEGEEGEETTHEIRTKVYKMTKGKSGTPEWGDMGVGVLRLKKNIENGTRRMLLRNSSTGKIVINFNIYTGMKPDISKNVVSFIGHDYSEHVTEENRGAATTYKLRVKTEAQAQDLKNALDREIEFVQSKASD
ncbi:hypothetical protein C8Q75DRAFT_548001 [Abortiporus biennis]|nr:hypothetical protein C8Q75DRAFT_548001 [Abortiporus biennis]